MILKRRMQIRLRQVPCIAGLREEAQIRDAKFSDQRLSLRQASGNAVTPHACIDKGKEKQRQANCEQR